MKRDHEVRFPDNFWRRATHLSLDAKGLYAILATFANYQTGETWVSNARLELESGLGRDKIRALLRELEIAGFISRRREIRKNLKSERHIRCLKYVCSMDGKSVHRLDGRVFGHTEKTPTIFTVVKSSVTPKEQEESSFPYTPDQISERVQ